VTHVREKARTRDGGGGGSHRGGAASENGDDNVKGGSDGGGKQGGCRGRGRRGAIFSDLLILVEMTNERGLHVEENGKISKILGDEEFHI
jgi:hypothetical protein